MEGEGGASGFGAAAKQLIEQLSGLARERQAALGKGQVHVGLRRIPAVRFAVTFQKSGKKRIFPVLKVKRLPRLDYKVEGNCTSEVVSKTRGQMSTWLLFSSFTICSLQTD